MSFQESKNRKQIEIPRRGPCGVVANVLGFNIVVSKFEPKSSYYIQFWTLGKDMKPVIPGYKVNSTLTVLLEE